MADGEQSPDDSGTRVEPTPDVAPTSTDQPAAAPAPNTVGKSEWQTFFAAWPAHLSNGLAHLGRGLSRTGKWLGSVGIWLAHRLLGLAELRPTPLQRLALLGGLAALSIFGALAFAGNPLGQLCVIAFVPGLCLSIGILGNRWYNGQDVNRRSVQANHDAVYATLQLRRTVRFVDERLTAARGHLDAGVKDKALIEVVAAKTATELSLGAVQQTAHHWGSAGAETVTGSVARVEDQYTLIINRGSEHGAKPDMVFAVLDDSGDQILDPETGAVIGELPTEKLRVKVIQVQPKYSRAVTFRTYPHAKVGYPAFTGSARLASNAEFSAAADSATFDSIDESLSRMLEDELGESLPVREKIANAKAAAPPDSPRQAQVSVDVGDRVRQVH